MGQSPNPISISFLFLLFSSFSSFSSFTREMTLCPLVNWPSLTSSWLPWTRALSLLSYSFFLFFCFLFFSSPGWLFNLCFLSFFLLSCFSFPARLLLFLLKIAAMASMEAVWCGSFWTGLFNVVVVCCKRAAGLTGWRRELAATDLERRRRLVVADWGGVGKGQRRGGHGVVGAWALARVRWGGGLDGWAERWMADLMKIGWRSGDLGDEFDNC